MDPGLDEDHAELGVHVLAVDGEVLVDGNGLFDEVVQVLGNLRGEVCRRDRADQHPLLERKPPCLSMPTGNAAPSLHAQAPRHGGRAV